MNAFLSFNNVTFGYDGARDPLFDRLNLTFPTGWTGIAGANGSGKSTVLHLAAGLLRPSSGRVAVSGPVVYCEQRTDEPPVGFDDFLSSTDRDALRLRRRLGIDTGWGGRWSTLSHGERKRSQIAVALWRDPMVLAIDEPTNHLDAVAREMLANALRSFQGIGLLVSHDRELMDSLCRQTLLLRGEPVMRPGGYTVAMKQAVDEDDALRDEYARKKRNAERLAAEAARRRAEAERADRKRSKKHLALRDHDGRSRIDAARVSGADGRAGRLASQLDGRVDSARQELADIQISRRHEVNFWLPDSRADRPVLHSQAARAIAVAEQRRLEIPDLVIERGDRIALTGVNGAGKSTLIRSLLDELKLPADRIVSLPQEIDASTSMRIMAEVNGLSRARLGDVMTIVNCLGSSPKRLVGNVDVSPGELRKVMLALGIVKNPWLIVMDEPTNHLDLPAVEALENALADCPCAMLLASHDARFLSRLTSIEWRIEMSTDGMSRLAVR